MKNKSKPIFGDPELQAVVDDFPNIMFYVNRQVQRYKLQKEIAHRAFGNVYKQIEEMGFFDD